MTLDHLFIYTMDVTTAYNFVVDIEGPARNLFFGSILDILDSERSDDSII